MWWWDGLVPWFPVGESFWSPAHNSWSRCRMRCCVDFKMAISNSQLLRIQRVASGQFLARSCRCTWHIRFQSCIGVDRDGQSKGMLAILWLVSCTSNDSQSVQHCIRYIPTTMNNLDPMPLSSAFEPTALATPRDRSIAGAEDIISCYRAVLANAVGQGATTLRAVQEAHQEANWSYESTRGRMLPYLIIVL